MRRILLVCLAVMGIGCHSSANGDPDSATADGGISDVSLAADSGRADLWRADLRTDSAPKQLSWSACDTSFWPTSYPKPTVTTECTTVEVPLDFTDPNGAQLKLRVARQKSKAFPTGKAVFQLAGGPGGASVWQAGLIPIYMPKLLDKFDLIYVDQRGTGSSDYFGCKAGYPYTKQAWIACASEYSDKNLNQYLTVNAAHDLEFVRKALGYEKIYLRGGSYGTRLGLEFVRQHASSLVAVVLDGLATPDWDYFTDVVEIGDRQVARVIADCNSDPTCQAVSPDLAADLSGLRQSYKQQPRPVRFNGQPDVETELDFRSALHTLLKDDYWRFDVPRAIHGAAGGDFTKWNKLLSEIWGATVTNGASEPAPHPGRLQLAARRRIHIHRGAPDYVAPGLFMTGICAEDLPNSPGIPALRTLASQQDWDATIADGAVEMAEACSAWKVNPIDASLRQPVQSAIPALLLSGGIDFITPAAVADHAKETLSNSTHLVIPNYTHSAMRSPCAASILTDFLNANGDMSSVDTSCLQKVPAPKW